MALVREIAAIADLRRGSAQREKSVGEGKALPHLIGPWRQTKLATKHTGEMEAGQSTEAFEIVHRR